VFPVETLPLRERRDDIPLLAQHFLSNETSERKTGLRLLEADARRLSRYDWPGNVRELQNVIERAVILSHNGRLRIDLPDQIAHAPVAVRDAAKEASGVVLTDDEVRAYERANIVAALKASGGKVFGPGGAAELMDMKPTTLASRIKALKIEARV
jgi:transcriptional regulator with GAF, ATPase, and Fis domain